MWPRLETERHRVAARGPARVRGKPEVVSRGYVKFLTALVLLPPQKLGSSGKACISSEVASSTQAVPMPTRTAFTYLGTISCTEVYDPGRRDGTHALNSTRSV